MAAISVIVAAACAGPAATQPPAASAVPGTSTASTRTLVAAVRVEPESIAAKGPRQVGVSLHFVKRLFNAELSIENQQGTPIPYLADAVPQLNTESWTVEPDGHMETTYHLRPNLRWHDGSPLTSDDFLFAWQVYRTPDLGFANSAPLNQMEDVLAPDASTVVVRWLRPYPDANLLVEDAFPPLPRRILEAQFQQQTLDAFVASAYWTREFVGLGPFRLERWEPGAFIEASAFDGHALGAPKISRLKLLFIGDANTTLASILAGEVQLSADLSLGFTQAVTLKHQWEPTQGGTVLLHPNQWRATKFQLRPDLANPRAILDARVRRALSFALDKRAINDAIYDGEGIVAESMIPPMVDYYPQIEPSVTKYPFDLRQSDQLMGEAGFRKTAGESFAGPEGRLTLEIKTNASAEFESEMSALAAQWRQAGFDMAEAVLPAAQAQDPQMRATFPSMFTHSTGLGEPALIDQVTSHIPGPANRWSGGNRGGYSNPDYDRLVEQFNSTLDRGERIRQIAQMLKIYTDDAPSISLFFATQPMAAVSALKGPQLVVPGAVMGWDIHTWSWAE
ncbi:MAG TPA: ABC transporter substrate-binding protein [Chloroflexota bacterium]|nr:ABC transporter substrate-binding protein [Chloroflexota bacterium]